MRRLSWLGPVLTISFAACAGSAVGTNTPGLPKAVEVGGDFELSPSQSAVVGGGALTITFVKVSEDSRCPTDVVCVWAGDGATALLVGAAGAEKTPATLHTTLTPKAVSSGSYVITLVGLEPVRKQAATIPQASYVATFRVTRQ